MIADYWADFVRQTGAVDLEQEYLTVLEKDADDLKGLWSNPHNIVASTILYYWKNHKVFTDPAHTLTATCLRAKAWAIIAAREFDKR